MWAVVVPSAGPEPVVNHVTRAGPRWPSPGVSSASAAAIRRETSSAAAVREAKDALRLRYANGEISREDYLQGKVELED